MKKTKLLLLFAIAINIAQAQQKAITEEGKEVILFENGRWKYADIFDNDVKEEIPVNSKNLLKDEKSTFLLKSTKNKIGYWINTKKWTFKKGQNNENAEYDLQFKEGDAYGMIISEAIQIPLETLKTIAIDNAKKAAPDVVVTKQEYRYVNGLKVLHMELEGTIKGIDFAYIGYYYSNSSGTTQFVCYTSQNLKEKYRQEILTLLNGITEY